MQKILNYEPNPLFLCIFWVIESNYKKNYTSLSHLSSYFQLDTLTIVLKHCIWSVEKVPRPYPLTEKNI